MKWEETTIGKVQLYQYRSADLNVSEVQEVWLKFFDLLTQESLDVWDAIKVEIWADSGRVIVFPGILTKTDRDENFCIEVSIKSLIDFWERLADSDIDDIDFDNKVNIRVKKLVEHLNHELHNSLELKKIPNPSKKLHILYSDSDKTILQTTT